MTEENKRFTRIPQEGLSLLRDLLYFFPKDREVEIWLVGGTIRGLLLGDDRITDFDLAVSIDPRQYSAEYARKKNAGFVVLDEEREIARVVKTIGEEHYTVDLARFRAPTIEQDLAERDFTVNAIAARLVWPLLDAEVELFDPMGGIVDLDRKVIVPCSDHLFRDDPLRIMRAFRFGARLGFTLEERLERLITEESALIIGVSGERIRDELFGALCSANSSIWFRKLSESGVLHHILPEFETTHDVEQNQWHHLDVFEHTILTLQNLERILEKGFEQPWWSRVQKYLDEYVSGPRSFFQLLKFSAILHDLGKPSTKRTDSSSGRVIFHGHEMEGVGLIDEIGERFKLSCAEVQFLKKVIKNHMRPGVMVVDGLSDRRLFKYFSETGRDGVAISILSLADRLSTLGENGNSGLEEFEAGILAIISDFYRQMEYPKITPLINGNDLIAEFNIKPGPRFGCLLEALKEAQHMGQVKTRADALRFAAKQLSDG